LKRLLLVLPWLLWSAVAQAQVVIPGGSTDGYIPEVTVATLPVAPRAGTTRTVTDGDDSTDCTSGGGATRLLCSFDGATWTSVSGGAGGSGDVESVAAGTGLTGGGTSGALTINAAGTSPITVAADAIECATCAVTGTGLSQFAATTSAALAGVLSDEEGSSGGFVRAGGNVATATALAANGANCAAGEAPLGVSAAGAAETCSDLALVAEVTVAALPAAPAAGVTRTVTDGATSSDCEGGGGSSRVLCSFDGAAWSSLGGGGSGDTPTFQEVFDADSTATITGATEAKPLQVCGDTDDDCVVIRVNTGGSPEVIGKCAGTIGGCDRAFSHNAGKKTELVDSDGNIEVSYTEDVGFTKLTVAAEAQGNILYKNDTAWTVLAPGTDGQILTTNGAAANPSYITFTEKKWFPFAACNNVTAALIWDAPTSNAAAAACVTGNNTKGVADFDATTDESLEMTYLLPSDFTGAIDARIRWHAAATSGSVGWCVQLVSVADAETGDVSFPAQGAGNCVSDAAKGTTLQQNDASITGVTATGVAAGELLHIKVSRDANGGAVTDDMTGDARGIGLELTLRRLLQ
jgi:hypothetical protein